MQAWFQVSSTNNKEVFKSSLFQREDWNPTAIIYLKIILVYYIPWYIPYWLDMPNTLFGILSPVMQEHWINKLENEILRVLQGKHFWLRFLHILSKSISPWSYWQLENLGGGFFCEGSYQIWLIQKLYLHRLNALVIQVYWSQAWNKYFLMMFL